MQIGFVGVGHMGFGMVSNLMRANHSLTLFDRNPEKLEPLVARGARVAGSMAEAASAAEVVITMLPDDETVEEVVFGPGGLLQSLPGGSVHVSSSTVGPVLSRRLAHAHEHRGQPYVAAPVLGNPEASERGTLVILAAGPPDAVARCWPLFVAMGKETFVLGDQPEQANVLELGVDVVFATLIEALGEAYALVERYGVDDESFLEVLNGSILRSPAIDAYGKMIAKDDFDPAAGFNVKLGAKAVRLALDAGEAESVPMPLASMLRYRFVAAMASGRQEADWSSVGRASTRGAAP